MDLMINVLQTDRWVVSTGGGEGGGVYCYIWAIQVCATVKGMVFNQFTLELLVFGVMPFKIDQNKNQNCSIDFFTDTSAILN